MQTIMAKEVSKKELEDIIAKGMIESIGGKVILLLSDEKSIVELSFKDGSVDSIKGDLNQLGDKIKVLMKRTATVNSS